MHMQDSQSLLGGNFVGPQSQMRNSDYRPIIEGESSQRNQYVSNNQNDNVMSQELNPSQTLASQDFNQLRAGRALQVPSSEIHRVQGQTMTTTVGSSLGNGLPGTQQDQSRQQHHQQYAGQHGPINVSSRDQEGSRNNQHHDQIAAYQGHFQAHQNLIQANLNCEKEFTNQGHGLAQSIGHITPQGQHHFMTNTQTQVPDHSQMNPVTIQRQQPAHINYAALNENQRATYPHANDDREGQHFTRNLGGPQTNATMPPPTGTFASGAIIGNGRQPSNIQSQLSQSTFNGQQHYNLGEQAQREESYPDTHPIAKNFVPEFSNFTYDCKNVGPQPQCIIDQRTNMYDTQNGISHASSVATDLTQNHQYMPKYISNHQIPQDLGQNHQIYESRNGIETQLQLVKRASSGSPNSKKKRMANLKRSHQDTYFYLSSRGKQLSQVSIYLGRSCYIEERKSKKGRQKIARRGRKYIQ
ncbi:hypothetical protein FGO68_gene5055 [Halteria grandinella]|uniref:Uncharacterized protein n=1 Tax=Halteria grandinella TaxID=5974 RepID=A0A8J8SXR9_HALGN|nr:hypothetical protein FGO68_gene5055 [Halteria grandinella]